MELKQVANYLSAKYLCNNLKADKKEMLKGQLLAAYSVGSLGASTTLVEYYDTKDFLFAEKGINIYTITSNGIKELIIRYDASQVSRIEFLKNIPNFYKMQIGYNESIYKHTEDITKAIYEVFPTGLNVNIEDELRNSSVQVKVQKKCDAYRVVNNNGLKVTISFEDCVYIKNGTRHKFSQPTLDVVCDSYRLKDKFDVFLREIVINHPKLIKIENNELTIARKNI